MALGGPVGHEAGGGYGGLSKRISAADPVFDPGDLGSIPRALPEPLAKIP